MTAREPSAVEVIAEAISQDMFPGVEPLPESGPVRDGYMKVAEAVLAAIRAMTPEQQAEVIGGEVQPCSVNPECGHHVRIVREVRRDLIDADVTRDHEEDER